MITKIETDKEGKHLRVYHRGGAITVDGEYRQDSKFVWTHPADKKTRKECVACESGNIPPEIKRSPR